VIKKVSKPKKANDEGFLSEITKIFGLNPDGDELNPQGDPDHKKALKEVKQAMKTYLEV